MEYLPIMKDDRNISVNTVHSIKKRNLYDGSATASEDDEIDDPEISVVSEDVVDSFFFKINTCL